MRSPKGQEASSITNVFGAEYELVVDVVDVVVWRMLDDVVVETVVTELVVNELVVVGTDDTEDVVVLVVLDGPVVET
ncbi:MAG TPA: hypothetical protein VEJ19_08625 [Nitrososphaerales archaeon]|nr:hypothetical protein [Nitrososphaerales archaeon]